MMADRCRRGDGRGIVSRWVRTAVVSGVESKT